MKAFTLEIGGMEDSVREFMEAFGQPLDEKIPTLSTVRLASKLIREEAEEVQAEFDNILASLSDGEEVSDHQKALLLKELCDLIYVVCWAANSQGMDLDSAFDEVHSSNMSKLGEDGKPIYREDGKVMKSDGYVPANVLPFV